MNAWAHQGDALAPQASKACGQGDVTALQHEAARAHGSHAARDMSKRLSQPSPSMTATTFLEHALPYRELSLVIEADRRVRDPIYGVHRWWARRPPALLRALLIASSLPADTTQQEFWHVFASEERPLAGRWVLDPFAGGGATLVEAARLGANVAGGDIDPLAVRITAAELAPPDKRAFSDAAKELLDWLAARYAKLYPPHNGAQPLHYFYIPLVKCPDCGQCGLLYRNLILARDTKQPGAVVRDSGVTCFCPECLALRHMQSPDAVRLRCCGRHRDIRSGTFSGQHYICVHCGAQATHRELGTGTARQQLVAVEETPAQGRRRLRSPTSQDIRALDSARRSLASQRARLPLPTGSVQVGSHDDRPLSYGISEYQGLFTPRQLVVLASALRWVRERELPSSVRRALEIAVSNALATNNRLCGYATDYGRLSALFSVRGYSLPALAVELNPLHPTSGRGTIAACLSRVERSATQRIRRYTWSLEKAAPEPVVLELHTSSVETALACRSAEVAADAGESSVDICVFDPPYFDYIAYDELSGFYRAWLANAKLAGQPLLPEDRTAADSFSRHLGRCLSAMLSRLRSRAPITFTYHSTNDVAWEAVGGALDVAELRITGLWPVRSDGHMGHHSHAGNSEWDVVLACRPKHETVPTDLPHTLDGLVASVAPIVVSPADRANLSFALRVAKGRFGRADATSSHRTNGRERSTRVQSRSTQQPSASRGHSVR